MHVLRQIFRSSFQHERLQTGMPSQLRKESNVRRAMDHLQRTAGNNREEVISQATIIGMRDESKTVKSLLLKVHDEKFSFKAGQWVDMFIPKLEKVGGFSMCSSPQELSTYETITLAIKKSEYPPAKWVHAECHVGSKVRIRAGGDIYFDPKPNCSPHDILLIAGGIGVNPLLSIAKHAIDIKKNQGDNSGQILFLYSAKTREELIFQDDIRQLSMVKYKFFVTAENTNTNEVNEGRILADDISNVWQELNLDNTICYLCGPPPMILSMEKLLIDSGLNSNHILVEKWW